MSAKKLPLKNMDSSLKVGIIGCGNIASIQLKYIARYIPRENIALCDRNQVRLEYLAKKSGIANTFADFESMLEQFRPLVVHILTPPDTHKDIAVHCLQKGCHIFLEKPMCLTVKETEEIVKTARKSKKLICVDHLRLFDPQITHVKDLLNTGKFGSIVNISTTEVDYYLEREKAGLAPDWLRRLPGKIFFDVLPHHLSLLNEFLPGLKVDAVVCQKDEADNLADIRCLLSGSNAAGSIRISLTALLQNKIVFECTKGIISVDFLSRITTVSRNIGLPAIAERVRGNLTTGKQLIGGIMGTLFSFLIGRGKDNLAGMEITIRRFYDAVGSGQESPVPGESGLAVMGLLEEIAQRLPAADENGDLNKAARTGGKRAMVQSENSDTLVTGGTGFIGRRLVNRLLSRGHKVRILTHRDLKEAEISSLFNGLVEVIRGNIANPADIEDAFRGVETVYHLAAATSGNIFFHLDTTVRGTQNTIDACSKYHVKRLVYVSTIALLNSRRRPRGGAFDEDFPYEENPEKRGNYAYAKIVAEKMVKEFARNSAGTKTVIIRPGQVYGAGKDPLVDIVRQLGRNVFVSIEYRNRVLPLTYIENLVDALVLAGESRETGTYHVVDSEKITVKKFLETYKEVTGEKFRVIFLPLSLQKAAFWLLDPLIARISGESPALLYNLKAKTTKSIYSSQRIQRELGWNPQTSFRDGLRETLASLR